MSQNRGSEGASLAVLLTHLKVFQHVGKFFLIVELPAVAMSIVVAQLRLEMPSDISYDRRKLYRHHGVVREFLGSMPCDAKARGNASRTIAAAPGARATDPRMRQINCDSLLPRLVTLLNAGRKDRHGRGLPK